ncbi:MAG: hypothetical protein ACRD2N_08060 [Vicinamibacterales bacterium]
MIDSAIQPSRKPVIVLSAVKEEEDNLRRALPVWSSMADHIVLVLQGRVEETRALAARFPKVSIVVNDRDTYDEGHRNELLVAAARKISTRAVFLCLDADEIPSAQIRSSPEWTTFLEQPPGTAGSLAWVHFWRSASDYIVSGGGAPTYLPFAFVDDGRPFQHLGRAHVYRGVGLDRPARLFQFHDVVLLHYSLIDFDSVVLKNHWYKAHFMTVGDRNHGRNNRNHSWFYRVRRAHLAPTPSHWLEGWTSLGFDVTSSCRPTLHWQALGILRWMAERGLHDFTRLDIWDVNWEAMRLAALAAGYDRLPTQPIVPPSRLRCLYYDLCAGRTTVSETLGRWARLAMWSLAR